MENAQKELLEHVEDRKVDFVKIAVFKGYGNTVIRIEGTMEEVASLLDFEYDSGYGCQELY